MAPSDLNWTLPPDLEAVVRARLAQMRQQDVVRRMWAGDPFVWTGADEDRWLGWLALPAEERGTLPHLVRLAAELKQEKVSDVVLLGMGGSSLAPEVIQSIVGTREGYPTLHVLDSTDPAQILHLERRIDLRRSLFIVASKSGTTLEVNILKQYFFSQSVRQLGESDAGRRFVLTTDPGSKLRRMAQDEHFREVFEGIPSVGGRYSVLSNFGMVPAAVIGADVSQLLDRAEAMARRCRLDGDDNSALQLGVVLGVSALAGRDKPTLVAPPALASFGTWLEQLIAESLGKQGKGIIPIAGETLGEPEVYGRDRVFIQLRSAAAPDAEADARVGRLAGAGHPVVRIDWRDPYALGGEFFRWEFATAIMGTVLGVNPFDQPDVEESKIVTRRLAAEFERTGKLPADTPLLQEQGIALFAGPGHTLGEHASIESYLRAFLAQLTPGDYFGLLAFIEMTDEHQRALQAIRGVVRDRARVATSVGFGPRFLHSTGQAHKGGPNSGVFLQITADASEDIPVPGQRYTFGTIELAQARGDFEVLASRGRRLLRAHLKDVKTGLDAVQAAIQDALN